VSRDGALDGASGRALSPNDSRGALYLVRHAKAGDRERWTEDDRLRPLTKKGRRQAEGLVHLFRRLEVARIVTSSYLRCSQTVRPLALARGLEVELSPVLEEGAAVGDVLKLLSSCPDDTVLCTHGDVIPAVIEPLATAGMTIEGEAGWKKGSTWILERRGSRFLSARYVPPPSFD
jgi:phosphohistidine phosphatase SixA